MGLTWPHLCLPPACLLQALLAAQVEELKQELDAALADAQEARKQLAGCSDELSSCRDQVGRGWR